MIYLSVLNKIASVPLTLFFAFCSTCAAARSHYQEQYQGTAALSNGENGPMSERQKAGFRGPVHECSEELITPPSESTPEIRYISTVKYNRDGRPLQRTVVNFIGDASSTYSITYAYDLAGRLVTMSSANGDTPASETGYTYDDKGRLLGITSGPGESSVFSYDNRGIRTRITKSKVSAALASSGTSYSFPAPEEEDPFLPVPAGGQIKTLFNEDDRPVEWQVLDANGNTTNRLIRSYDDQDRVSETSFTMENLAKNLPTDFQENLMAEPGGTEELAKEITRLLGSKQEFMRMTYQYDAEGRLVEKRMYVGSTFMQMITNTAYNDHSDKIEERTTTFGDPNSQSGGPDAPTAVASGTPSQDTLVRYSYNYDTFGNWTEQTMSAQSAPGAPLVESTVTRRTITYY